MSPCAAFCCATPKWVPAGCALPNVGARLCLCPHSEPPLGIDPTNKNAMAEKSSPAASGLLAHCLIGVRVGFSTSWNKAGLKQHTGRRCVCMGRLGPPAAPLQGLCAFQPSPPTYFPPSLPRVSNSWPSPSPFTPVTLLVVHTRRLQVSPPTGQPLLSEHIPTCRGLRRSHGTAGGHLQRVGARSRGRIPWTSLFH